MRPWTLVVVGLLACGDKEEDTDVGVDTLEPEPEVTDTGGGEVEDTPFVPTYVNIDAHFGVDATGQVTAVTDSAYPDYTNIPYLLLYIGSAEWAPGDWSDGDNLCYAVVDISGSVAGGDWVAENGLWFGFETPASAPVVSSDCEDMADAGYDPYTYFGADFVWSVGVGPLLAPYVTAYEGDTAWVGGYASVSIDATPNEAEALAAVAWANTVDPTNMYYDYYAELDAAEIPLAEGGITPGYYHVITYNIIELP